MNEGNVPCHLVTHMEGQELLEWGGTRISVGESQDGRVQMSIDGCLGRSIGCITAELDDDSAAEIARLLSQGYRRQLDRWEQEYRFQDRDREHPESNIKDMAEAMDELHEHLAAICAERTRRKNRGSMPANYEERRYAAIRRAYQSFDAGNLIVDAVTVGASHYGLLPEDVEPGLRSLIAKRHGEGDSSGL